MSVKPAPGPVTKKKPPAKRPAAIAEATHALEQALSALTEAAEALRETPLDRAGEVFKREVRSLLGDATPDDDAVRRAARLTLAEQAWERRLGDLLDTSDVVALLSVSRQQVSALAAAHRLIVLKEEGRHRFPAWQFAGTDARQRACLAAAHHELVEVAGYSPWSAASWFLSDHGELDDDDPVAFLRAGGRGDQLLDVARRDAARASQ